MKAYRQKRKETNEKSEKAQDRNDNGELLEGGEEEDDDSEAFRKEITVCEDFPSRVMKARNDLRRFLRDTLKNKKEAYLKYDKLIINGEIYEYDETSEYIVQVQTVR